MKQKQYGKNKEKYEKLISKEDTPVNQDYIVKFKTPAIISQPTQSVITKIQKLFGLPITKVDLPTYYSKWWKFYDNMITLCNLIIVVIVFYDYEVNFKYPRNIIVEHTPLRLVMISFSFLCIFCVIKRHYLKHQWRLVNVHKSYSQDAVLDNNIEDKIFAEDKLTLGQTITDSDKSKWAFFTSGLFFDIVISLILPYPRLDFHIRVNELDRDDNNMREIDYLMSDFIYIIVLLRSLYLFRAYINYSIFSDMYAVKVCKEYKVVPNNRFIMKCILKTQHIKFVFGMFICNVVIFGGILRIVERPFWVAKGRIEFENYLIPPYEVFVAMLTIGFGDFAPLTLLGKFTLCISTLLGIFITSFLIVSLNHLLDLSNEQFMVFTKIIKSRIAVNFIETAFDFHKKKTLMNSSWIEKKICYREMLQAYFDFRNMRNESKSIYRSNGLLHYNMKLLKEMKYVDSRLKKIETDLIKQKPIASISFKNLPL